ncbi:putative metal-binding motif-containing protein [Sorangium sp. So ce861]|uniref:putative metal-binding motif-containing protein n=1 Tax=Sorangium sp. So ce861 TaxID=3133323 RepID=UPI003F5D6B88
MPRKRRKGKQFQRPARCPAARGARGCGRATSAVGLVDGHQELDCRDDLPSVHPGAEEVCGDGSDNHCDGATCGDGPEGTGGSGGTGA